MSALQLTVEVHPPLRKHYTWLAGSLVRDGGRCEVVRLATQVKPTSLEAYECVAAPGGGHGERLDIVRTTAGVYGVLVDTQGSVGGRDNGEIEYLLLEVSNDGLERRS